MTTTAHPLADKVARMRFNRALKAKGVPAKACSKCFTVKALSQFSSDGRGGLRPDCKPCCVARQADYEARNPEKVRAKHRRYRAKNREELRQAQAQRHDTYRAKWTAPDGSLIEGDLSAPKRCTTIANGGCERLLTRGDFYGKRDTADGREPRCKECKARRDAERKAADRLKILDALLAEGHDRCHICQGPFAEGDAWEVEHIWPRSDDGDPDDLANLALAHASCNASKHAANPWEFLPRSLAEVGIDFHAAVRALMTYGEVVDSLDDAPEAV